MRHTLISTKFTKFLGGLWISFGFEANQT